MLSIFLEIKFLCVGTFGDKISENLRMFYRNLESFVYSLTNATCHSVAKNTGEMEEAQ